jgi:DNA-binding PadR family transcriptional regulator
MFSSEQQLHNNTIYPLLKRFLKSGWITQRKADGDQTRLLYALTPSGKQALADKLSDFSESDIPNPQAFRLRIGLFDQLNKPTRQRILELRDGHLAARLSRIRQITKAHIIEGWPARLHAAHHQRNSARTQMDRQAHDPNLSQGEPAMPSMTFWNEPTSDRYRICYAALVARARISCSRGSSQHAQQG